jgi:hypothetical protein
MISQLTIQEQDVWEAWIEFNQFFAGQFGTLYISGEFPVNGKPLSYYTSTRPTETGTELVIHMQARPEGRCRIKEFLYSEPVQHPAQYESICIYAGDEPVALFHDIEILV